MLKLALATPKTVVYLSYRGGEDMDEIIIDKGCGLDVHKETVVACVVGSGIKKENRTFSTKTNDFPA